MASATHSVLLLPDHFNQSMQLHVYLPHLLANRTTEYNHFCLDFPGGSMVKNLPAMQETQDQSLGGENPLEKEMATHSIILACEIPETEKPEGL